MGLLSSHRRFMRIEGYDCGYFFDEFNFSVIQQYQRLARKYTVSNPFCSSLSSSPPSCSFLISPRHHLYQSINLNIDNDHACYPSPQSTLHLVGTDSLARVFCGGHWIWSNETSASLLASVNRPAHHLVPGQNRPGRSGRCYTGTREHPRLSCSLEHFFLGE